MRIPKYNAVQSMMKRAFYNPKESVFLFTEDKPSDKIFYNILFKRLNDDSFKILKVEPIGSKSTVIEKSIEDVKPKVPSLYIVDGDIKLMLGQRLETKNLIAHNRYCIENFLCCEDGILDYLHIKLGKEKQEIINDLDFKNYLGKNGKLILKLYYRYALSFELGCGKSFKHIQNFVSTDQYLHTVDKTLIETEIKDTESLIKEKLKNNGIRAYSKEMNKRLKKLEEVNPQNSETIIKVISGKDMLFPLICSKIKNLDNSSRVLSEDQIKRILAEKIDMKVFGHIRTKIKAIL
jgi:hypothetical protein|tara:strand:- start:8728 stop:9603 length:876 start_codon:yes stop_codon:yes gene_type:complete